MASIASGRAMMRTGPGQNYPGTWLYMRRDLPIRVHRVYRDWREIEDPGGTKGWMLVSLLSDQRTGIVIGEGLADAARIARYGERRSVSAPSPMSSAGSRAAPMAGAISTSAAAAAISASTGSGASSPKRWSGERSGQGPPAWRFRASRGQDLHRPGGRTERAARAARLPGAARFQTGRRRLSPGVRRTAEPRSSVRECSPSRSTMTNSVCSSCRSARASGRGATRRSSTRPVAGGSS